MACLKEKKSIKTFRLRETVNVRIICSPEGTATGCSTNGSLSSDW